MASCIGIAKNILLSGQQMRGCSGASFQISLKDLKTEMLFQSLDKVLNDDHPRRGKEAFYQICLYSKDKG